MTDDSFAVPSIPWLLLIHQIPPKPDYLRVKIGRRLQRVGAIAVKNSVYVLPDRPDCLEDFQWIRAEITDGGGDASICRVEFVDGLTNAQIEHLFRAARDEEYTAIAGAARELWTAHRAARASDDEQARPEDELARLRKRLSSVVAIDFCSAPGRAMAEQAVHAVIQELEPERSVSPGVSASMTAGYRGRTWVTRSGVFVDRIASAWLIRRFIDRDARFRFVSEHKYRPSARELRFDMVDGEFGHEGDRCTFETLLARFGLNEPGLQAIAEIVHDIDLKDERFARAETDGIESVLAAIAAAHADDDVRLTRGAQLFDDLYTLFSKSPA